MDGRNIIGSEYAPFEADGFKGLNASTGEELEGVFFSATQQDIDKALTVAEKTFRQYSSLSGAHRASFLRAIASEIQALGSVLTERAALESGLPLGRITGETGRTVMQLDMFASLIEDGSWVDAVIDTAQPDRTPMPRSDLRKMLIPLGPTVVFGASNFPLAFSVAGGDTASALASGCPVIVKAHPAHPGTSALVGEAIMKAAEKTGVPKGVFSLLFDSGYAVGSSLVKHPKTKAVTFTGSYNGGMALVKLAGERPAPIPVFAEMGSINPVLLMPLALRNKAAELATKYAASITLGAGQFCTNPGLLLAIQGPALDTFIDALAEAIQTVIPAAMLTQGICSNYQSLAETALAQNGVSLIATSEIANEDLTFKPAAIIAKVSAAKFISNPQLSKEIFGPYSLLVIANDYAELEQIITRLEGQLTATVMAEPGELEAYPNLLPRLSAIAGRIIFNGVPTGVEVCHAMQHGGPFPATNDSRFTSVGTAAIYRFVRPVCWQDCEQSLLPKELQDINPLGIMRLVNNKLTNTHVS